jgi:hypothetical protein
MDDGQTEYLGRMDMVKLAAGRHGDLPFIGWNCGRQDGFATWQEQIDMVRAMTASHHGFAFSWNNGGHDGGKAAMGPVLKYYPPEKFAMNLSYPAFGNSSIDGKLGNGDPKDGDMEGGINLGFDWTDPVDEAGKCAGGVNRLNKTRHLQVGRCLRMSEGNGQPGSEREATSEA